MLRVPNIDVLVASISHGFFRFDISFLIFRSVIKTTILSPVEIGGPLLVVLSSE